MKTEVRHDPDNRQHELRTTVPNIELLGTLNHCPNTMNPTKNRIREENELGCKLSAKIMLANRMRRVYIPDGYEWVGVNLLERDDELVRRKRVDETT